MRISGQNNNYPIVRPIYQDNKVLLQKYTNKILDIINQVNNGPWINKFSVDGLLTT